MTFVDWVKWLVGFLCTHLHTHNNSNVQRVRFLFFILLFFFCELHLFQFLCMPHILFSSLRASYFLHLLPATATAAAEVVWMWHVLPPFISHFVAVCLSVSASASTSACLNLCPYLPQSIPLRDNLSIQLFIFFLLCISLYKRLLGRKVHCQDMREPCGLVSASD